MKKTIFATVAVMGSAFVLVYARERLRLPGFADTPAITAVYDTKNKTVNIKWQQKTSGIKNFAVQRSTDNVNWTDISLMENAQFSPGKIWIYNDVNPGDGENYYRLRCTSSSGKTTFSATVMVITGSNHNWIMYPVPVGDILTLQYKGAEKITGVINVQIQSINGTILNRLRCASNTTLIRIPVNNLGRGIYDIRIMIAGEIVWNQRFAK